MTGRHQRRAERLEIQALVGVGLDQLHVVRREIAPEVVAHAARAHDAAGEQHPRRAEPRLEQHLHVLAHGVVEPRDDGRLILALVGQVGHVGLEDDRATPGQRGRLGDVGAQRAGGLDRQLEALDQLAQEVAGALRAARVLAVGVATGTQLEDREYCRGRSSPPSAGRPSRARRALPAARRTDSCGARCTAGAPLAPRQPPAPPRPASRSRPRHRSPRSARSCRFPYWHWTDMFSRCSPRGPLESRLDPRHLGARDRRTCYGVVR